MGNGSSKDSSKNGQQESGESKSQQQKRKTIEDEQEILAFQQRVESELPRIRMMYKQLTRYNDIQSQMIEFCRMLYAQDFSCASGNSNGFLTNSQIQSDRRYNLAATIFMNYLNLTGNRNSHIKFENFLKLYAIITQPVGDESMELVFKIFLLSPPEFDKEKQEQYIMASRFQDIALRKFGLDTKLIVEFSNSVNITEQRKIYKSEFREIFNNNRDHKYFNWVLKYNQTLRNIQNAHDDAAGNLTKLEKMPSNDEIDFTLEEKRALENFFDSKIASQTDLKDATKCITDLFKDRSIHLKLRNRIAESFLYASSNHYFFDKAIFLNIMRTLFKDRDELNLINFIFDIFTRYSKDETMDQSQIREVFEVFKKEYPDEKKPGKPENNLISPGQQQEQDDFFVQIQHLKDLSRATFIEYFFDYCDMEPQFVKIRSILYIELKVRPERGEQEFITIYNTLDKTMNLNKFAIANMNKGDKFYLMNKKFYDQWLKYAKSNKTKKDPMGEMKIENEILFDSKTNKVVPLKLNENFVILPGRVWVAFVNWYGSAKDIMREVIEYPNTPENSQNQSNKQIFIIFQGPNNIRKISADKKSIIELEVDLIMIKTGQLLEDAKEPENLGQGSYLSAIMDERSAYQQIISSPNFSRTKQGDQRWHEVLYRGQT